jgi:hypothetical protein
MRKLMIHATCLLGLAVAIPVGLMGQGGVKVDDINVTGDWVPNLGNMEKPDEQVTPVDNKIETKEMTYEEKQIKAPSSYDPLVPKLPAPPKPPMDELQNNLVKISFGRFASPYAKIYLNSGRNVNGRVGLDFSHASSSKGYLDYAEWRDDIGGAYGEYYTQENTFKGNIRIKNSNYFYFADTTVRINPELKDSIRNTFTKIEVNGSVLKNYNPEGVNYDVGVRFQGYFDRWDDKEMHFSVLPKLNWKITDKFGAGIYSDLTFSNSSFDTLQQSRFFLDVTPTVTFKMDGLNVQGGIKVNSFTGTTSKFAAYPVLKANYQLVPDKLSLAAGLVGEMRYLKYYDLIDQNRYLDRQPDIRPMRDALNVYLGVDGQLAKYFTYTARVYTKKVKDQLIYFNPENAAYFQMQYDSNFTQSGAELSLIFNKNDKVRAGIKGDFRSFRTSNIVKNFNMPGTKVDIWGSYNFANKVWIAAEVYVFGPRTMGLTNDSIPAEIKQGVVADVNLSAEYRFSKRLSVFLELNNLLDNRWQRWYNYQERPFDIKGGLTFSF